MNKDGRLLAQTYNRVVLFEQTTKRLSYFIKEHFYKNDQGVVAFNNNNNDDNTALGNLSQDETLGNNGFRLVAKFDGTNGSVRGDETTPMRPFTDTHNARFFVGYRTINNLIDRESVMSSVKGAAQYLEPGFIEDDELMYDDTRDNRTAQQYPTVNPYYHKAFYGITHQEYNMLMAKAINAFLAEIKNTKYDYVIYPSGRSRHAEQIARALAERVVVKDASTKQGNTPENINPQDRVITLQKLFMGYNRHTRKMVDSKALFDLFSKCLPGVTPKILRRALRTYFKDDYTQGPTRVGQQISTASHQRSLSNAAIYRKILTYPSVIQALASNGYTVQMVERLTETGRIVTERSAVKGNGEVVAAPGGHFDMFCGSHMDPRSIQQVIDSINDTYTQAIETQTPVFRKQELDLINKARLSRYERSQQDAIEYQSALQPVNDLEDKISNLTTQQEETFRRENLGTPYQSNKREYKYYTQSPDSKISSNTFNDRVRKHQQRQVFLNNLRDELVTLKKNLPLTSVVEPKPKDHTELPTDRIASVDARTKQQVKLNLLFVDDNINSGDMYKQMLPVIEATQNMTKEIQFFFLLCKEEYAPAP